MLRKLFHSCKLILLFMLLGQCQKCSQSIYEDAANWTLVWQAAQPMGTALPEDLDLEKGITCYVAVDNAVYFLNPTGECWKFTQTATGPTHEAIDNLPDIEDTLSLFAFVAGPTPETRVLHVGAVTDDEIVLYRYTPAEGWRYINDFDLSHCGIHNVSNPHAVACSIHDVDDGEWQGLIALQTEPDKNLTMLVYEPSFESLKKDESWHYKYPGRKPTAVLELAPSRAMLIHREKSGDLGVRIFTKKKNSVAISINSGHEDNIIRAALFPLSATKHTLRRALLLLHRLEQYPEEHVEPSFYILQDSIMIPALPLPKEEVPNPEEKENQEEEADTDTEGDDEKIIIDHKESLVLTFGNQVCFITQNSQKESVYYVGALGVPKKNKK